jgi:hypothetical protein
MKFFTELCAILNLQGCKYNPSISLFTGTNAYDKTFIEYNLSNIQFDFLIDDGPHTLDKSGML